MRTTSPNKLKHSPNQKWDTGEILLPDEAAEAPLDFAALFPDRPNHPVEMEIGCGKGTFLLGRAKFRPELNYIGIEYARPYAEHCSDRFRRHGLDNIRMFATDAGLVVKHTPDESLLRLHIYYPDPWPKRRHKRRRLIQPAFLDEVRRVLVPGGQLLLVTDHRDYFEHMLEVIADVRGFARCEFPRLLAEDVHTVGTNFENKYIEEGRSVHKAALLKYI